MENKPTFKDLLSDMPLAVAQETINITGVIARSPEPEKFVVLTANGGRVTLPVDAVVDYQRMGGSIGQEIVHLQLKADQIPVEAMNVVTQASAPSPSNQPIRPFLLATPHHVSADTLAAMQALSGSDARLLQTNLGDDTTARENGTFPLGNGRWHLDS